MEKSYKMQQMYNVINEKTVSTFYLKKRISMAKKAMLFALEVAPKKHLQV